MDEWIQEGIQKGEKQGIEKGIEKGRLAAGRDGVVAVLEARFDLVPSDVTRAIANLSDESILTQLIRLAAKVADLDPTSPRLLAAEQAALATEHAAASHPDRQPGAPAR